MVILAGLMKVSFNLTTFQDNLLELDEVFKALLNAGSDVAVGNLAYITITDDTRKYMQKPERRHFLK